MKDPKGKNQKAQNSKGRTGDKLAACVSKGIGMYQTAAEREIEKAERLEAEAALVSRVEIKGTRTIDQKRELRARQAEEAKKEREVKMVEDGVSLPKGTSLDVHSSFCRYTLIKDSGLWILTTKVDGREDKLFTSPVLGELADIIRLEQARLEVG